MPDVTNYGGSNPEIDNVSAASLPQSDLSRILPRQLSTGTMRGTQRVGYGNALIDGSNNIISVGSTQGTQGIGNIPNSVNEYGFFQTNSANRIIYKQVQGTQLYYNPLDAYVNSIRIGGAPVGGRPGIWVGKQGVDVTEVLSRES